MLHPVETNIASKPSPLWPDAPRQHCCATIVQPALALTVATNGLPAATTCSAGLFCNNRLKRRYPALRRDQQRSLKGRLRLREQLHRVLDGCMLRSMGSRGRRAASAIAAIVVAACACIVRPLRARYITYCAALGSALPPQSSRFLNCQCSRLQAASSWHVQ
jgi:hypothetical protein